jgi:hypothetical protein
MKKGTPTFGVASRSSEILIDLSKARKITGSVLMALGILMVAV